MNKYKPFRIALQVIRLKQINYSRQFKHSIKCEQINNEAQDFYVENPHKL